VYHGIMIGVHRRNMQWPEKRWRISCH